MSKPWLLLRKRSSALFLAVVAPLIAAGQLAVGAEKAVSTPEETTIGRAGRVDVASNGATTLVVWSDRRTDVASDVFATLLDRNGRPVTTNIAITATPEVAETDPYVEFNGTVYQVFWFDGTNTLGAEIDTTGVIVTPPVILRAGMPTELARGPRAVVVGITDPFGTTLGTLQNGAFVEGARVRATDEVAVVVLENGYMVFFVDYVAGRAAIRAIRVDARGRAVDTPSMAALGSFNSDVTLAAAIENDIPILVAAARDRLVVARVTPTGAVTVLTATESITNRSVHEVSAHPGGFDIITIVNGTPRTTRYSADVVSNEASPLNGPATSGAAAQIGAKLFTVWSIDGVVTGRNSYSTSDPAVVLSKGAPNQQMPALASDGVAALAVWIEDVTESEDRIMARLLSRDGTPISLEPATIATRDVAPMTSRPAVAYHGNEYYVAWVDARNGLDKPAQLSMRTVDRAGRGAGSIPISSTVSPTDSPALASGGASALLVWAKAQPSPRVRAAFLANTAQQIEIGELLDQPDVAFGNGAYVVVGRTPAGSIRGVQVLPTGVVAGALFDTNVGVDSEPAIAFNGSDFLVVFERSGSVYARFVGSGLEVPVASSGHHPRVVWDGEAFAVAWSEFGNVSATRVLTTGVVETATALSATPLNEDFPALLGLEGGSTLAAYQRMVPGLNNVHRVFTRVMSPHPPAPPKPRKRRAVR